MENKLLEFFNGMTGGVKIDIFEGQMVEDLISQIRQKLEK